MPKSPKKTLKKTLKKVAKAPAKKAAAKKPKAHSSTKADAPGSRRGFMWKVLEQKQLKQKERNASAQVNPFDRAQPSATTQGFGRFHGPRRRVG